ncbi:MAG: hypothetical protein H8D35_04335 [Nitrosopumilus sp.]|nr:hypothetical protein [Nitrosopumilus sp.]
MTKSKDTLIEIIHRPVTFTANTIEKDTVELNKAISQGYLIHDSVKTETGIVYVLAKWKHPEVNPDDSEKISLNNRSLKDYYNEFWKEGN